MKGPYALGARLNHIFKLTLAPFEAAALVSTQGDILALRAHTFTDFGTLAPPALTGNKFFPFKPGDLQICCDPYSGGDALSRLTLVMGLSLDSRDVDFLLVARRSLPRRMGAKQSIEEEGVRIPPTAIFQAGQWNDPLLKILDEHPLSANDFSLQVRELGLLLQQQARGLEHLLQQAGIDLSKKTVKDYLSESRAQFLQLLDDLSEGDVEYEWQFPKKERLAFHLANHNGGLLFDFSGSKMLAQSHLARLHLTDAATIGICIGAVLAQVPTAIPHNSGVFSCFNVVAPKDSFVHAKYPQPVEWGFTDGAALLVRGIWQALSQLDSRRTLSVSALSPTWCTWTFSDGKFVTLYWPYGGGAEHKQKGLSGAYLEQRGQRWPSIEQLEVHWPLRLQTIAYRQSSGGGGQSEGGRGLTVVIESLGSAQISWRMALPQHKAEGAQDGKSAAPCESHVLRAGEVVQALGESEQVSLLARDHVITNTGGGGGFGPDVT